MKIFNKNVIIELRGISMQKILVFVLILSLTSILSTACSKQHKPKPNMIQAQRRFAKYVEYQGQSAPNTIDLSEGPRQNYDRNFEPRNLEFDIKVVDPYKY